MPHPDQNTEPAPPRVPPAETINEGSRADEAALESFPASDAPAWTGSQAGHSVPPEEDETKEEPERG